MIPNSVGLPPVIDGKTPVEYIVNIFKNIRFGLSQMGAVLTEDNAMVEREATIAKDLIQKGFSTAESVTPVVKKFIDAPLAGTVDFILANKLGVTAVCAALLAKNIVMDDKFMKRLQKSSQSLQKTGREHTDQGGSGLLFRQGLGIASGKRDVKLTAAIDLLIEKDDLLKRFATDFSILADKIEKLDVDNPNNADAVDQGLASLAEEVMHLSQKFERKLRKLTNQTKQDILAEAHLDPNTILRIEGADIAPLGNGTPAQQKAHMVNVCRNVGQTLAAEYEAAQEDNGNGVLNLLTYMTGRAILAAGPVALAALVKAAPEVASQAIGFRS